MKASLLIEQLQDLVARHGDLYVQALSTEVDDRQGDVMLVEVSYPDGDTLNPVFLVC